LARSQTFDMYMPIVKRLVLPRIEFDRSDWHRIINVIEQQQFHCAAVL
jgi:hypothetical protein